MWWRGRGVGAVSGGEQGGGGRPEKGAGGARCGAAAGRGEDEAGGGAALWPERSAGRAGLGPSRAGAGGGEVGAARQVAAVDWRRRCVRPGWTCPAGAEMIFRVSDEGDPDFRGEAYL